MSKQRERTRKERYNRKKKSAHELPLSLVTINFEVDDNLSFLIRTAACYGVKDIYVIGSIPERSRMTAKSGSLIDYVNLREFSTPKDFIKFSKENDFNLISAEIAGDSKNLFEYEFDFNSKTCLVLGNERTGVPVECLLNGEVIFVPMIGVGYCLNTSQTGTAILTEYARQYLKQL